MKITLKNFTSRIGDVLKDVEYNYVINEDSTILKIEGTMYNEIDEEKYFVEEMSYLLGINEFVVYHGKYKFNYKNGIITKVKIK